MDKRDKSENISEMINQDGMLLNSPVYETNKREDNDKEENRVTTKSNGNIGPYPGAIHKDGNCTSTKEREKTIDDQESKKEVEILYNRRALTKLASTYKLEMFEKNLLIIYNFIKVDGYSERIGTIQDANELESTFKMYGFEVEREGNENLTVKDLLKKLDEFDKRDFTEYGCVAVAVMTHGTWGGWLMAKDGHFSENEIIDRLKARTKPSLVTKPVVLIIQACRGANSTKGVRVNPEMDVHIFRDQKEETQHYYLPVEADILVVHSTYIGKPAFRPKDGTWFIQTLCKKIRELAATEDLESIMTEVKREVAINKHYVINKSKVESEGQYGDIEFHKQVPTVTSTLIRKLYLFKKIDVPLTLIPNGNVVLKDLSCNEGGHSIKQSQGSDEYAFLLQVLDYFKKLLRYYAAENIYDTQAHCLLQEANNASNYQNLNFVRFLVIAISSFLKDKYQKKSFTKYIYWYGDDSNRILEHPASQNISMDCEELAKANGKCLDGAPLSGAQNILDTIKKYKTNYLPSILVAIGTYTAIQVAHNVFKNLRDK